MKQRKRTSFVESLSNCIVGVLIAFVMQVLTFPYFGIEIPISTSGSIALLFTAVSIVRSYLLRRAFEWLRWTNILP